MTRTILSLAARRIIPAILLLAFVCMYLARSPEYQRAFETPANPSPVNLVYEISKLLG